MPKAKAVDLSKYPERVTLCFRTKEAREFFMGQLSDGFGENECDLDWPKGADFYKVETFGVEVFGLDTETQTRRVDRE